MNSNHDMAEQSKKGKLNIDLDLINSNDNENANKLNNFKNFIANHDKLRMKRNIIIKISNQLINGRKNITLENSQDLDLLQMIDILNYLDKSFSFHFYNDNNNLEFLNNNMIKSNNNNDFYFQQEFNMIKNIYSKISKDYDINLIEPLEVINRNFINISNKQINLNLNSTNNKYNSNYYYIYNILYDFFILILILNKNDFNNKQIKYLSPVDRIFLCEESKEQKLICDILTNYLDIISIINKENICPELKSIYYIISLFTKIKILKKKAESGCNCIGCDCCKKQETNNLYINDSNFNKDSKNDSNIKNKICLSQQDFCKIILKKDFIINQLESKIEILSGNNNNENTFRELEEENETNKKEIEDMKKMYDLEFELMASAVYGLGINLFFNKEQQHNEQMSSSSSWLNRQKDYIMEQNE